jgi:hypothetical protein
MLTLMFGQKVFEVMMNSMKESINFFERRLCQLFNLTYFLVNHAGKFSSFILILFGDEVKFIQENLTDLTKLLSRESEILV